MTAPGGAGDAGLPLDLVLAFGEAAARTLHVNIRDGE